MASHVPALLSVTLTAANTNYSLLALLRAIDADFPAKAQMVQIQHDPAAGADLLWIGNEDMSATNHGVELVATQAFPINSLDSNLINLGDIWLRSDGAGKRINVAIVTR